MGALYRLCVIQKLKLSKNLILRSVCPLRHANQYCSMDQKPGD